MNKVIYIKWSPSIKDQFYTKSKLSDKHIAIGNSVIETILKEGHDFIVHETKREFMYSQMNKRDPIAQTNLNPYSTMYKNDIIM